MKPDESCIYEKGSDKGFIGNKDGFFLLTLVVTSKGFENVDAGNSQCAESLFQRQQRAVQGDVWMR